MHSRRPHSSARSHTCRYSFGLVLLQMAVSLSLCLSSWKKSGPGTSRSESRSSRSRQSNLLLRDPCSKKVNIRSRHRVATPPCPPVPSPQAMRVIQAMTEGGWRPVASGGDLPAGGGCPQALVELLGACCSGDPAQRPSFAEALAALAGPVKAEVDTPEFLRLQVFSRLASLRLCRTPHTFLLEC